MLYNALFLPFISYCICVWGNAYPTHLVRIQTLQKRMIRIIAGVRPLEHTSPIFKELQVLKFFDLIRLNLLKVIHSQIRNELPSPMSSKFQIRVPNRETRQNIHFVEPFTRNNISRHSLFFAAPKTWNCIISRYIPDINDVPKGKRFFKLVVKKIFLDDY